jgi:ATP-dependent helicase/nuclease subunit A
MSAKLRVPPLHGNQMRAVAPEETVWLAASAGTGKTQVLSSRVLRLLLELGVSPSQILCLTFTKAGATEMASRINDKLAKWVRMDGPALADELKAIGADFGPEVQAHARTLFAQVLDCPGGGLRIDTIHAFAQWLLGAFPHEAGLIPGARAMEDRERLLLQRQVLADLLVEAEHALFGDPQLLKALAALSLRLGPEETEAWLMRCAQAYDVWLGPAGWQEPMRGHVERLLGMPEGADESHLAALCSDDAFAVTSLSRCLEINAAWKPKTGQDNAAVIADWLSSSPLARSRGIDGLHDVFHTKKGTIRASTSQDKINPDYPYYVEQVAESIAAVRELQTMLALAEWLIPALRLGRAFALAWDEAKQREGLIDFDDQIRSAAALLTNSDYAQWIGYKLDRRFDHILVDEAQDTNAAQWKIIDALTGEFFSGQGQRGDIMRTLFVVGDDKQAIFRFQGTSPENFRQARERVRVAMLGAAKNAQSQRSNLHAGTLLDLGLDRSFRTARPVLKFVDAAIELIGHEEIGLPSRPEPHQGLDLPGHVALWRPIGLASEVLDEDDTDEGAEDWLSDRERELADRIARQVRGWVGPDGFLLSKGGEHRATPGDVMILVRKRGALAALLVARLHAHGVAVAGVDRLRLGAPLAVKDLIAAVRFAAQPFDCLNLAALLVSPLLGWSQEQLLEHGYRGKHLRLWDHLRQSSHPDVNAARDQLGALLRNADFEPPQALIHWLLSGPWQGRRKLVARLGHEANDPIDELLNAAHAYAVSATPSLVGFLAWFDAGDGELKREAESGGDFVRVMTVHGAKGLQSPIVILADATANPENARKEALDLTIKRDVSGRKVPLPRLRREEELGRIALAREQGAREIAQEHWRLLYVAMTRAEEALFVAGALGQRDKVPAPGSWYARLSEVMGDRPGLADDIWTERLVWGDAPLCASPVNEPPQQELPLDPVLPAWLSRPPADEERPPRPLAPSSLGEDMSAQPPSPPSEYTLAARRGVLIHKLLERLPGVAVDRRSDAGRQWLARNAPDLTEAARGELLSHSLRVLSEPDWADLFAPGALAEVPIAALVGDRMVAGTIDRLLIDKHHIRLIDYKTASRPPGSLGEVPASVLRQMAAYACALEAAYPGRKVEAALLYTQTPRLLAIPAHVLEPLKKALRHTQ